MRGGALVAACLSALNEERTIRDVLVQVSLCPLIDLALVVVNGSTDRTAEMAGSAVPRGARLRVRVAEVSDVLGHDVGRSVAAEWALSEGADVLLFLDADFAVRATDLAPFVRAVADGTDVALNRLGGILAGWPGDAPASVVRRALNVFLGRPDLGPDSMVVVPHALSRRAVETLGPASLAVPPVAQARAVMAGLTVRAVHMVNVIGPNRPSPERPRSRARQEMVDLIVGDHVEAVAEIVARRGARGGFSDLGRKRPPGSPHTALRPRQD